MDGFPRLLRAIDCYIGLDDRPDPIVAFAHSEIEALAELEHQRFCAERLQQQWLPGVRNPVKHTSDSLKPWNELEEPTKDLDRNAVRQIPRLLAEIDRAVYRIEGRR